ncbi:relaxase/mobilization nuclease domain-containing protein [uncultured Paracoccus sp.]|uniref:relaxase/mobilization nuclease domain-containing protein n=1 Tax=uncultured Paracoccus sp. TaxID=189685 RepID=UPI002604D86D|nr:relaxase/mobilization nuclease domain-containing protein [uncultured Paracoccus sp.]
MTSVGLAEALIGEIEFPIWQGGAALLARQQAEVARAFDRFMTPRPKVSGPAAGLWRVAQGSNAVVLKKIHNGGTHTGKQLGNQLDYLFSKAAAVFGNMADLDPSERTLDGDQRRAIVDQWSDEWTGDPKNGQTTHLLVSFPVDVSAERARPVVEEWCMELFQSGLHSDGEEWAYVAALHTDRVNKHVHVVVNNRGLEHGDWFFMAKDHAFNLDFMKERLVEIAGEHGLFLDKSSRLDRGILTYGPTRAEIERAAREGRAPIENRRQGRALSDALDQIQRNIEVLRSLAVLATLISDEDLAKKIEAAARLLEQGGIIHHRNQEIVMDLDTIRNRGDLATAFGTWLEESERDISRLPVQERRELREELYGIASEIVRDLGDNRGAQLMHHAPRMPVYQAQMDGDRITVQDKQKVIGPDGTQEMAAQIGAAAEKAGINPSVIQSRMETGAANAWQEREWIKADILAVADAKKIDLSSEDGRGRAAELVDTFYAAAARVISRAVPIEQEALSDKLTRTLSAMADAHAQHGKVEFQGDEHAARFGADFRDRYGAHVLARLAAGDTNALAVDFPDAAQRRSIARAVAAAGEAHQSLGMTLAQTRQVNQKMAEQEADEHHVSRRKDLGHEL